MQAKQQLIEKRMVNSIYAMHLSRNSRTIVYSRRDGVVAVAYTYSDANTINSINEYSDKRSG